ncbi:MAG: GAF and ANTAR domain-containing protein [Jatrophihabitantaceae bacterium]
MAEFDDLDGLDGLDGLIAGMEQLAALMSEREPFQVTLGRIAEFSAATIRGFARLAVSVIADGRPVALAASDATVHDAEALQYTIGEGPALTAVADRAVTVSGSLGGDPMWPRFGSTVARTGLHSVLVAPMIVTDTVIGALSVYASGKNAFDEHLVARAERYSIPAAALIHNMHLLHQSQQQVRQLSDALRSRSVIDQAIGILRSRNGGTPEEAFQRLRRISNADRIKLVDVAQQVVERSVRRARARRLGDEDPYSDG